jgi:glutamyl-tRNA synthetase
MGGEEELRRLMRLHALRNAARHGRADVGAVMGKLMAERPELRPRARELLKLVEEVVGEVNALDAEERRRQLLALEPARELPLPSKEEKRLPPLPDADRFEQIVTRFAPNPDSVLHLGSARAVVLNKEYARMYGGKFLLRFEDTDPRLKRAREDFYRYIIEDLRWLGCEPDDVIYQSDRLELYYKVAEELLRKGAAYVCTHPSSEFRQLLMKAQPCSCRGLEPPEQLRRWAMMLDGTYGEGEAVVRVKTDLSHPNPALRDWPALRIIDARRHPHPRTGSRYRVWPLYNFSAACDDWFLRVSHIIRGKEHYTNMQRQLYLYAHMGWRYPVALHYGRLMLEGGTLSKSQIERGIREGRYEGYDDPRLATLRALRRRGFLPETIRQFMLEVGVKPAEVKVSWEKLYALQRQLADPVANRYFAVRRPVLLVLRGVRGVLEARLRLHPADASRGYRRLLVEGEEGRAKLLVEREDAERLLERGFARLMGLANVHAARRLGEGLYEAELAPGGVEEARARNAPFIHWLPASSARPMRLYAPDEEGEWRREDGFVEENILNEKEGALVQLERLCFARVDGLTEPFSLYYTCPV